VVSVDRWTLAVAIFVVAGALCTGCGKDSAAGGSGAAGSDQLAPTATPNQSEIDRIKAQRMPPANLANQRPGGPGGQGAPGGGAPYGAPGGGTTFFKGN
jgi:hypothetical protein